MVIPVSIFCSWRLLTHVIEDPDMSIWEVRNHKQHFTYSQVMLWVAFDRGLRLAEKRNLPCPNRAAWLQARDSIYEEVMEKGVPRPVVLSPALSPPF